MLNPVDEIANSNRVLRTENHEPKIHSTRMHSSRMRTGRSLIVCRSLLLGGDVCCGGVGVCSLGVSALGGGLWCLLRGVSAPGGCLLRGVSAQGVVSQHALGVWGVSAPGGRGWYPSMH